MNGDVIDAEECTWVNARFMPGGGIRGLSPCVAGGRWRMAIIGCWRCGRRIAQHVLHYFEQRQANDGRPRRAIEEAQAWARGEITMTQARVAAYAAHAAAREAAGAAREAARAAGHAVAVAHMADHELGAAAYAIRAVRAGAAEDEREEAGRVECRWQRAQLPAEIRELVLDDQRLRNQKCWSLFSTPSGQTRKRRGGGAGGRKRLV